MKKIILGFAALSLGLVMTSTMTSCKKDRTCKCTYTDPNTNEPTSVDLQIGKSTKATATLACETQQTNLNTAGFDDAKCSLD